MVTMLPNNDIVREVYMGKNGVLETVQPGSFLIDSSTVDPSVSKTVAAASAGKTDFKAPGRRLYFSNFPGYEFLNMHIHLFDNTLSTGKDATFVDAPVSGGVLAVSTGTLTFMVGSDTAADFEKAKSLLMDMGKNVTHCGKVGSGGAVKICNNSELECFIHI